MGSGVRAESKAHAPVITPIADHMIGFERISDYLLIPAEPMLIRSEEEWRTLWRTYIGLEVPDLWHVDDKAVFLPLTHQPSGTRIEVDGLHCPDHDTEPSTLYWHTEPPNEGQITSAAFMNVWRLLLLRGVHPCVRALEHLAYRE